MVFLTFLWLCLQPPIAPVNTPADVRYRYRLEALRPDDPGAYFLLGEEVADAAANAADSKLAVELQCLAFEIARQAPATRSIAAAAALALTELDLAEKNRRFLQAMARVMDPARVEPAWLTKPPPASPESQPYKVAVLLGLIRSGDGVRARQMLTKPDVRASLQASERMLLAHGLSGGIAGLEREAAIWPCPSCSNRLLNRRPNTSPPEYRPCSNCGGNPGPVLSPFEFTQQLRLESFLLQGSARSWAAQGASDRGEPLIDPDPAHLCSVFGVDPARVYWRAGRWCITPECAEPSPVDLPGLKDETKSPTVPAQNPAAGQ
ncbi:MAG: hypothetical protein JNK25_07015 [Phycisphaerae bacterium]|nr:hypothetical protein [Phycisphaerae bacterium]